MWFWLMTLMGFYGLAPTGTGVPINYLMAEPPSAQVHYQEEKANTSPIQWQSWDEAVFTRAQKENRLVVLDLEAIWCHWCHVMDQKTYTDPQVYTTIQKHYLPVRADQDARPDLSARYQDYGWPATIIFAPDGTELAKRSGFIAPEAFAELLNQLAANPVPEKAARQEPQVYSESPFLSAASKKRASQPLLC